MIKIELKGLSLLLFLLIFVVPSFFYSCSFKGLENAKENKEEKFRNDLVENARELIGSRYRYGGKTPKKGFDCSGFTQYVYGKQGITLRASSRLQAKQGDFKEVEKAKPGDLVFFGNAFKIDHVGIVTQNKKGKLYVIHSTNSQGVVEHDVFQILYWKKRIKFARDIISD